jgi:CO dehydrogenase nickel-insertion accessory protein CooC1
VNAEPQTAGNQLQVDAVFDGSIVERRDVALFLIAKLVKTSDGCNCNKTKRADPSSF